VYSRIKVKSLSEVNFLAYYGSISQSTFTKFLNLKMFLIRFGTVRLKWKTGFRLEAKFPYRHSITTTKNHINGSSVERFAISQILVASPNNIHRRSRDVLLVSGMRNLGHPVPLPEFRFYVQSKQFGEEYKV
jgi:hypothetical protein